MTGDPVFRGGSASTAAASPLLSGGGGSGLRLTLLTPSFDDTQLLRVQSLWLLARHLGHVPTVVTTQPGDVLASLATTPFAAELRRVTQAQLADLITDGTDLLCTAKPLAVSLGLGSRLARSTQTPLLADVDDPDLEVHTIWSGRNRLETARRMAHDWRQLGGYAQLALTARRATTSVSNPVLQRRWGGELVPHARTDPGEGAPHTTSAPQIAFVGTTRRHKGVQLLRQAVTELAGEGWRLVVTAKPPADARPWETWLGPLDGTYDAAQITAAADVVVVPSEPFGYGRGQLPLKLVDAMLLGRAVVVSDVGPLPWAVGGSGPVFRTGSVRSLVEALRPLSDAAVRAEHGRRARAVALERYTVESAAPAFQRALTTAMSTGPSRPRLGSAH